ncbi:hypothetical protein JX266_002846 [Neoarthrinium moseri]|nr:hypothetical protein JX266_002846 [Neoarthrinium moseri]
MSTLKSWIDISEQALREVRDPGNQGRLSFPLAGAPPLKDVDGHHRRWRYMLQDVAPERQNFRRNFSKNVVQASRAVGERRGNGTISDLQPPLKHLRAALDELAMVKDYDDQHPVSRSEFPQEVLRGNEPGSVWLNLKLEFTNACLSLMLGILRHVMPDHTDLWEEMEEALKSREWRSLFVFDTGLTQEASTVWNQPRPERVLGPQIGLWEQHFQQERLQHPSIALGYLTPTKAFRQPPALAADAMWSFGTTMTIASDEKDGVQQSQAPATPSATAVPPQSTSQPTALLPVSSRPDTRSPILSDRSLRQMGFFFAGAGFLGLSTLITRRAVARKIVATIPRFYEPSNRPVGKIDGDGGFVAVEALGLATLNVFGFAIMSTGGLSWAFDISSVDELRSLARRHTRGGVGETDEAAEQQIAEWAMDILQKTGHAPKGLEDAKASDQKDQ